MYNSYVPTRAALAQPSARDQPMASFGENLRREREMRGISLEEISAATKVSVRFLECLEDNEFSSIPGGIFTRGFIRAYAGYLGLNEEQVMAEYLSVVQPEDYELGRLTSANRPPSRRGRQIRILPLGVAAGLLIGGYALFRHAHRTTYLPVTTPSAAPSSAESSTSHGASTSSPATPAVSTTNSSSAPAAGPNASPAPTSADGSNKAMPSPANAARPAANPAAAVRAERPASAQDGLVLQVAATEPVWVSVEADGKTCLQRVVRPNDVTTLKAQDNFELTTGNAQALILTLNGETLKPLGRQGEVKKVHLTRSDVKSPSP
jgi:cytoskeleton protein RodZ